MALRGSVSRGAKAASWALLAALPTAAMAADLSVPAQPTAPPVINEMSFAFNIYGWASGISGKARTLPPLPAVDINLTIIDNLKNLDGALMATGQVKVGRAFVFTDWVLAKISPDKEFSVRGFPFNVTLDSGQVIGLGAIGYRMVEESNYSIDILGGVRGFSMNNTLTLKTPLRDVDYGKRETWFDAVAGLRFQYDFTPQWSVTAIALAGAGQSKYEWDLFGGIGYRFNERWGAFAGFRALKVDYSNGNYIYDMIQYGPTLGVHVQF